jgi:very-short-patch-repair endonuclease
MEISVLDGWATRHHGVITKQAALTLGWSRSDWYRAVGRGHLELLHPGVARLHGSPRTPLQRIQAAVLGGGRTALASHRSGARLWGVERPDDDPVDLIVDRSVTRLDLDGVVVHRPTDRDDLRSTMRALIPTTNLLRTLVDLGAVAGSVDDAVSSAITSGAVTPLVLRRLVERHGRPGRNGVGALRRALDGWPLGGKPADSELELRMARFVRRHALPPVTFHPPRIAGFEVDFLVDGTCVVLECDGWEFHGRTRAQFERDRERDQLLGAAGYVAFHFTWRQITRHAARTAARLRALLETWAPEVLEPPSTSGL